MMSNVLLQMVFNRSQPQASIAVLAQLMASSFGFINHQKKTAKVLGVILVSSFAVANTSLA